VKLVILIISPRKHSLRPGSCLTVTRKEGKKRRLGKGKKREGQLQKCTVDSYEQYKHALKFVDDARI